MSDALASEKQGGCLVLTLNRPLTRNALDPQLISDLDDAMRGAAHAPDVSSVVLTGAGESFCAGADLNWMRGLSEATASENQRDAARLFDLLERIARSPKVVIASVHGATLGGGVGLIAACDLVVATASATFALPEVRLGLAPAMILPFLLLRVSPGWLRQAALLGERIDASVALRAGLVNAVSDEPQRVVADWTAAVAQGGPCALARTKELLWSLGRANWEGARQLTTRAIAELRLGEEAQARMRAFFARRK